MLKEEIVVGKAYVNERTCILREVTEELDEQRVKFNAFDLANGRLLPSRHRVCPKEDLAGWAQREATPKEQASVHPFEHSAGGPIDMPREDRSLPLEAAKAVREAAAGPHTIPQVK